MKIAYTGTHGTGKTTAALEETKQQKIQNPNDNVDILTEIARKCPFKINKKTTEESQLWILTAQIKSELEKEKNNSIVVCDRTILDTIAYAKYANLDDFINQSMPLVKYWMGTYDKIYFLTTENNDYFLADGVRDMDMEFRDKIEYILKFMYSDLLEKKVIKKVMYI